MFLRVSSLRCASHVESNLVPCLPLPRPSTRCGVVNQHERQVVEGLEVRGGREVDLPAGPEIDGGALVRVLGPGHGGRGIGREARRVNQGLLGEDAHRARPLDGGQGLVERAADRIVVSDEAGRLAGAQEEVRERVGAILESAGLARGCGNRHCDIITKASTDYIEDHLMRCLAVLLCVAATSLGAQQPEPPPDSTRAVTESITTPPPPPTRSEEHTSELQSQSNLVCRLLLEKKN